MPRRTRQVDDFTALAAVCRQRFDVVSASDLRWAIDALEQAAFDPSGAIGVAVQAETRADSLPVARIRRARAYAKNLLESHGLIPDSVLNSARRELARRDSVALVAREAATERDSDLNGYWRDHAAFTCKGSPRSGIRGRACPILSDEIRTFSAVSRNQRDATAVDGLASGCRTLALEAAHTASGGALVTETALAQRDGQAVVVRTTARLDAAGRVKTRGCRSGSNRRRRGKRRTLASTPPVEYVTRRK